MKKLKFTQKPVLALLVIALVISVIIYIEAKKPELSKPKQEEDSIYIKAPDFVGIEGWINSDPLTIDQLKGKVVLVDFWTYTCINCIRTLPYLKEWDKKYRDLGLVIVGVHTPEFEFEKKYENVLNAVNEHQIKYPVAQDNQYATWNSYQNRFWPHKYLVDVDGNIRYDHIGEGAYEETEKMIQLLLKERMERINEQKQIDVVITTPGSYVDVNFSQIVTPEIYLGYEFSRGNFGNEEGITPDQVVKYTIPSSITRNNVYFSGEWKNNDDNIELVSNEGEIILAYQAKTVNIVAGSENSSAAKIFLDNNFSEEQSIGDFKLYKIASADDYGIHLVRLNITGKGFKVYTFTFG